MIRDSQVCGHKISFDFERLLESARVKLLPTKPDDGISPQTTCIAFPTKVLLPVWKLFATRFELHKEIYQQPNVKIVEHMIFDALTLVKDFYPVVSCEAGDVPINLLNAHENDDVYEQLDDTVLVDIRRNPDSKFFPAQNLFKRVDENDFYHPIVSLTTRPDNIYANILKTTQRGLQTSFMDPENIAVSSVDRESFSKGMLEIVREYLKPYAVKIDNDAFEKPIVLKHEYGGISRSEHPLRRVVFFYEKSPNAPFELGNNEDMVGFSISFKLTT